MVIIASKTTSEIVGTMYQQCFNGFQKFFKPWVPMFVKKLIQVPFSYKKPEPQLSKVIWCMIFLPRFFGLLFLRGCSQIALHYSGVH